MAASLIRRHVVRVMTRQPRLSHSLHKPPSAGFYWASKTIVKGGFSVTREQQRKSARALRAMHDRAQVLVLPNVWDAMSARIVQAAGARGRNHQRRHPIFARLSRRRIRAAR